MRYATSPSRRSRLAGCTFSSGIVNRPASTTRAVIARSRYWHGRTPVRPVGRSRSTAADAMRPCRSSRSPACAACARRATMPMTPFPAPAGAWQRVGMDSVVEPRLEGTFRVATHRRISFAEYGDPHGRVVFWFHGTPGGRTQISPQTHPIAMEMGIRLILLDRPGVGFSTPHVYPNVLGFADDVGAIADALGEERFAVVGL